MAPERDRCACDSACGAKLPQANTMVANSTSQGTRCAKKLDGVTSSSTAPQAPPTRLMITSALKDSPAAPVTRLRPVSAVAICAGNRAMVEVMLAARASMPVNISAGRVTNEPPPASAFCTPAHSAARNRTTSGMGTRTVSPDRRCCG